MPIRPLSKELLQKAEDELHEVPERVQEDIKNIQHWLSTQPHINSVTDDQWLVSYLRSSKFSYKRTMEKLELYSSYHKKIPELFGNRDPLSDEIQQVLNRGIYALLPRTVDPAGPRIIFFRGGRCDPTKTNVTILTKVLLMIMEILYLEDDNCVVAGLMVVVDLEGFSYKYLTQITPFFLRKAFCSFLYAYPTRLRRICYVNAPSFFAFIYRLVKIFVPEKMKKRIHVYNDFDDLNKDVPQSILPKEYGGEEKECDKMAGDWKRKIESYRKWFMETSQLHQECKT